MAEKTFSTLVSEVLAAYPQIIASKNEVEKAKNEVLGAKADLESTKNEVLNTQKNISNELNSTKSEISSQLNTAKSEIASALNTAQKAGSDATKHATSAKNYAQLAKISQQNANNSVLAANEAKLKALEAQTKSEVYFREARSINARFKSVAKDANSTLKTTAINVAQALGNTTDFQLGRMEFKRRQVNSKIDEANEIIAKLEDNSAVGEIKRALRENVWDHAILQCGMMDIMLSKAVMMFLTLETKDIKEQTALIAQEVELDRLDIQRQKQNIYTLNEQAKNLVKALEAKVAI
ncbi:MAG: hypothetical protein MR658_02955 [Campylobacter sp.]|uniref:hypothetical protein n=1 Tax=Campylobacter sp. TaxID=205 RepID=UPI002A7497E3|nr:hypothetical protein [Campylobacter sp.]MCI6177772.1 hypothetical protein [Campylobacter sp.]MCI6818793.1 hypothetical protein [Campylobacter sp.]MDY3246609.1 hypothetical protein [Campylobacter sp.]MDY5385117.1 hypothetical protein [Campylobacter sp.]